LGICEVLVLGNKGQALLKKLPSLFTLLINLVKKYCKIRLEAAGEEL
jgi:hypothetical protein